MSIYEGYITEVVVDPDKERLIGRTVGTRDNIIVSGETFPEVTEKLRQAIDEFLVFCSEQNIIPDKSYSGIIEFTTRPEVHRALVAEAAAEGISVNALIEKIMVFILSSKYDLGNEEILECLKDFQESEEPLSSDTSAQTTSEADDA